MHIIWLCCTFERLGLEQYFHSDRRQNLQNGPSNMHFWIRIIWNRKTIGKGSTSRLWVDRKSVGPSRMSMNSALLVIHILEVDWVLTIMYCSTKWKCAKCYWKLSRKWYHDPSDGDRIRGCGHIFGPFKEQPQCGCLPSISRDLIQSICH